MVEVAAVNCYSHLLKSFGGEQLSSSSLIVGLLLCDTVHDYLLGSTGGDFDHIFSKCLSQVDDNFTYKAYRTHLGELPNSVDECDVWLINGSPNSVYYDLSWIKNLIGFVQQVHTVKKPLVGICFGHQIIATALGGKVEKSDQGWGVGMAHYPVTQAAKWMQPKLDHYNIWVFYQDQVTELPKNAQILSGDDFCPAFMVQYDEFTMSIQGHPELIKDFFTKVLNSDEFDHLLDVRAQGLANLDGETSSLILFTWIANFLRQAHATNLRSHNT